MQFPQKADCLTHYDDSLSQRISVTECVCKIPPEGAEEKKDE